jgi:glycerol-3-phosphate dehydrogenase subunit B
VAASLDWFREHVPELHYAGSLDENVLVPTAVGVAKPTVLLPEAMQAGDLRSGGRFVFVGLRALKSFYPAYLADNLGQSKLPSGAVPHARAIVLSDPGREADVSPLDYARRFEDPGFRAAVANELGPQLEPEEVVGFPAVLGLDRHRESWLALQELLEHRVFEVPTLPPSVPGIRLYRALRDALRRAGVRIILGPMAIGAETDGARVAAITIQSAANRSEHHRGRWFVLATGGFATGAIQLDSFGEVRETVFGLPVAGVPEADRPRFLPGYFDDHPIARAGLSVDERLRPLDAEGRPAYENLFAAGAVLGGAEPWREQSGNGLALATGFAASAAILEATA